METRNPKQETISGSGKLETQFGERDGNEGKNGILDFRLSYSYETLEF